MSNFGSFTARFTVLTGAPAKPDFKASELTLLPNAPPQPTDLIQVSDSASPQRTFRFDFRPALPNGQHELEGGLNETVYFGEGRYGYTVKKSLIKIDIDSTNGTYTGTFHAEMADSEGRKVLADGEFDLKVVPK